MDSAKKTSLISRWKGTWFSVLHKVIRRRAQLPFTISKTQEEAALNYIMQRVLLNAVHVVYHENQDQLDDSSDTDFEEDLDSEQVKTIAGSIMDRWLDLLDHVVEYDKGPYKFAKSGRILSVKGEYELVMNGLYYAMNQHLWSIQRNGKEGFKKLEMEAAAMMEQDLGEDAK